MSRWRFALVSVFCFLLLALPARAQIPPIPYFSGPQDVSNLINYLNQLVQVLNQMVQVVNASQFTLFATTSAMQTATTTSSPNGAWRNGTTALGDSPPLFYMPSASACSLNGGNGDGGWQIKSSNNKCWIAVFPITGVDARWYGDLSTSASTILAAIDTAMGDAGWSATTAKTILLPRGTAANVQVTLSNVVTIQGVGDYNGTVITPDNTLGTTGQAIRYVGAGPFILADLEISCASYIAPGVFAEPAHCGNDLVLVEPTSSTTQVSEVRTRGVRFVGGANQLRITNTNKSDIEVDEIDSPWFEGVTVSQQANGAGVFSGSTRVYIKKCMLSGEYCASLPVNVPPGGAVIYASRDIDVKVDSCIGAGFPGGKGCVDVTGQAGEQMRYDIRAMNVNTAGEAKMPDASFAGATPQRFSDRFGKIEMTNNFDSANGFCWSLPYPGGASSAPSGPNFSLNESVDVTCSFAPASAWVANQPVVRGQVYATADNNVYQVVQEGTTGATKPVGNTPNFGIADGTALVAFRSNFTPPQVSTTLTALLFGANSYVDANVKVHNVGNGVLVRTIGSSDNTLRNVTLTINGEVQDHCLSDAWVNPGFGTDQTIDHFTIVGSSCVSLAANQEAINIGNVSGGNSMVWTNFRMLGSRFTSGATAAAAFRLNGGAFSGDLIGSRLSAGVRAILANSATTMNVMGGELVNTAGAGSTGGVIGSSAATGSGTVVLQNVTVSNSAPNNTGTLFTSGGSTLTAVGTAINIPPSANSPSATKCNDGLDYTAGSNPTNAFLWGCHPDNTWVKAY